MFKSNKILFGGLIVLALVVLGESAYIIRGQSVLVPQTKVDNSVAASLLTDSTVDSMPWTTQDSLSSLEKLKQYLVMLDTVSELRHGKWGFCLADVAADTLIASYNAEMSLVPASVMKIFTTGTVLSVAGPEFAFHTQLLYDGSMDSSTGTLHGNIYIKGGGDPSLGSLTFPVNGEKQVLKTWVNAIQKLGIDSIDGAIIADASLFEYDMIPAGWAWEDMQGEYCAGASGLSFRENMCALQFSCSSDTLITSSNPIIPGLIVHNGLTTNNANPQPCVYVSGTPYSNERFILGTKSSKNKKFSVKSQIPDPPGLCSYLLLSALQEKGIGVKEASTSIRALKETGKYVPYKAKSICSTYSPPLQTLVNHTNRVSQNFYAESLLKLIGVKQGETGSTYDGALAVRKFWESKGIDMTGFFMVDGSGLSRNNAITASQLTQVLQLYKTDSTLVFDDLYKSLPIAGKTGTLKWILKGTLGHGNVHAKSGSMRRVKSYAGYVHDKNGRLLAFSMIANDFSCSNGKMRNHWVRLMKLMAELD